MCCVCVFVCVLLSAASPGIIQPFLCVFLPFFRPRRLFQVAKRDPGVHGGDRGHLFTKVREMWISCCVVLRRVTPSRPRMVPVAEDNQRARYRHQNACLGTLHNVCACVGGVEQWYGQPRCNNIATCFLCGGGGGGCSKCAVCCVLLFVQLC